MSASVVTDSATSLNYPEIPDSSTCKQSLQVGLDALPYDSILVATGRFARISTWQSDIPTRFQETGSFKECHIRPVPLEGRTSPRVFEVLLMGASRNGDFAVTIPELITSARVLVDEGKR